MGSLTGIKNIFFPTAFVEILVVSNFFAQFPFMAFFIEVTGTKLETINTVVKTFPLSPCLGAMIN